MKFNGVDSQFGVNHKWPYTHLNFFDPPGPPAPPSHSYILCLMYLCHTITNPFPLIAWLYLWMPLLGILKQLVIFLHFLFYSIKVFRWNERGHAKLMLQVKIHFWSWFVDHRLGKNGWNLDAHKTSKWTH